MTNENTNGAATTDEAKPKRRKLTQAERDQRERERDEKRAARLKAQSAALDASRAAVGFGRREQFHATPARSTLRPPYAFRMTRTAPAKVPPPSCTSVSSTSRRSRASARMRCPVNWR